jgi:hypothetical protein
VMDESPGSTTGPVASSVVAFVAALVATGWPPWRCRSAPGCPHLAASSARIRNPPP